ncbi:NHL repeat containing protein [Paenibacillus sp. JDR-2]|nr:NHL repeat containing protein [Paenibacillus sp. JDR-2]
MLLREPTVRNLNVHYDLRFLDDQEQIEPLLLRAGGQSYPLVRHTAESLSAHGFLTDSYPTHYCASVPQDSSKVQFIRVFGPPDHQGIPTLKAAAISTATNGKVFNAADTAKSILFLNPSITVLTPDHSDTVLNHMEDSDELRQMVYMIEQLQDGWNTPTIITDEKGQPVLDKEGKPFYTYELHPILLNLAASAAAGIKSKIYSDATLRGVRYNVQPGISHIAVNQGNTALTAVNQGGYHYNLKDGGPQYGVSVAVEKLTNAFELDLKVTNSYIRHMSVYATFYKGDGSTPIEMDADALLSLLRGENLLDVKEWMEALEESEQLLLGTKSLKFIGNVSAEGTFLGIPVTDTSSLFSFQLPTDDPIGKLRLSIGSLGYGNSHSDADPNAAWIGIGSTSLMDLVIPTVALIMTVGTESSKMFDTLFKKVKFIAPTVYSIYTVVKDIINDSSNTGNDVKNMIASLADRIVSSLLTGSEFIEELAAILAAEEVEEAIPVVGWGLKAIALEGSVVQLAQTVAEVIASPRVVDFELTVTMDASISLLAEANSGEQPEFAATAAYYIVTAQYSDNTTRTYRDVIPDSKVSSLSFELNDVPVGGKVTFLAAIYSKEGWLVGGGKSEMMDNLLTPGKDRLVASVKVTQMLYPLNGQTTYQHSQLLIQQGGQYAWQHTAEPPTETAEDLGTGGGGHVLESLVGITLNSNMGLLGYAWQASGLNIPPVDGDNGDNLELYAFKNISYGPNPNAGVMNTPKGYNKAPLLAYPQLGAESGAAGYFYLDPTGDQTNGFHLRRIKPVNDPTIPQNSPEREFDLSAGESWGRFNLLPASMAYHSNGYVIAVNPAYPVMQILQIPSSSKPDDQAPWALITLGPGTREGLVQQPELVAIASNQTVYVLEKGNQRIQAFSRGGHPVAAFADPDSPYWINLVNHDATQDVKYLAMSVEIQGHIYVLSQYGNGYEADQYFLDIYTPAGSHLVTQRGLVAASMAVDLWRNLYTLNFQQILSPEGCTEPSVSEWTPSTPRKDGNQ